ncbi:MAG TPA: T9SS type B sorting domain-containing protein, partial [Bacteroidia bacterium]|nr:T9SS type B sorting domain-containing protein [Bacteroidia bacterium]
MRFPLRALLLLFFLAVFSPRLSASHLMGGEITWACQGNGQFVFNMKLYRDCNGIPGPLSAALDVYNNPNVSSITMNLVSQTDISPQCNSIGPSITCANASSTNPLPGAVEEYIYASNPITLSGVPPAAGWVFVFSSCCRNTAITNLAQSAGGSGFTLRAIMHAYNNQNENPCFDNSPEFLESPRTIICTGYPFTYNHNAVDPELDSLAYSWAQPLDQITPPATWNPPVSPAAIPFVAGFSYNSPMPGTNLDPNNVPATMNPYTGEISYTSFTSGNFVTCVKVEAWKCGQLVAEIYREIQVVLLPCGNNTPPSVIPPFAANTVFQDTVYAGQLVNFTLTATDFDFLPNGQPQTLTINASGQEFGANFTNPASGCLNPPCATLNPPPPVSGPFGVSTDFSWQTACNHVNYTNQCFSLSNTYNFVLRTSDDFCPAPAQTIATISITVLNLPIVLSPHVHCVAVAPNGDVTLTWDQPVDTAGTFDSYHIFSSPNPNGPFTEIDSIFNYNQLSYTHTGANANNGSVYYYVETRSGCGGQVIMPPQDTVRSIFLNVTNSNNVAALLTWNNISNPPPSTQYPWFRIYREYPTGNWVLIDSTQSLNYVDSIQVCNNQINYRIEIGDSLGCVSVSNVDGDHFTDNVIPQIPQLDSVSLDSNDLAVIGWNQSASPDVIGYVVYQYLNGIWTALDTIWGRGNTSYTNLISNAGQQSEQYEVAALDSCGNISSGGGAHNTLFLNSALDICNSTANLWWNSYVNFPGGLGGYEIYACENGGPYSLIGTTVAGTTTYADSMLNSFSTYCYYVVAFNSAHTIGSRSQKVCVYASVPQQPVFNYFRVATVTGQNSVLLKGYVDVNADVQRYDFYRTDTLTNAWTLIGSVPASPLVSTISFTDNDVETDVRSYYYRMMAIDSCGNPSLISNVAHTVFLQAFANDEITNTLMWNDYSTWDGSVMSYNVYRSIDGVLDPVPVATVPFANAGTNVYTDDVSAYINYIGKFSYLVEAVENPGNQYGLTDTAYSNYADVVQKPLVYVPNAFSPNGDGLNDIFIPSNGFIDVQDYDFAVFNRWGEKLFQTNDQSQGWDGHFGGKRCDP